MATLTNAPTPVSAAASRVNSTSCSNSGATTIACTVTSPTNGNTMIAVIGTRGTTGEVTSITQTGATWSQAVESINGNGVTVHIWYASNVSSAGTSVTVNLNSSVKASAVVAEYSGLLTSSALDQTATNTGASTSPSSGTTATTSTVDQLWIGGMASIDVDDYSAPTNSFTLLTQVESTGQQPATRNSTAYFERVVSATGTASVGATLAASQQWAGAIATFEAVPTPTQIQFTTAERTITAGTCSGAGNVITIQIQDAGGTPTNPTGSTTIRITSNSPTTEVIYSDDTCSTQLTNGDISFTTSENTKSFYIIDTRKSNPTWTLSATQQTGPDTLSSDTQNITVNAGAVSRLVVTLPGQSFTDGTGNSGSPTNRTAGSSFNITSISATDAYFNVNTSYTGTHTLAYSGPSNAPNTTAPTYTTSVDFTTGQSTTTLATTLFNAESTTITVTDGGSYGYASSSVTVDPGILADYVVTATTSGEAGECVTGNSIAARDAWENSRTTDTSTVNMTSSGTSVIFYTNSGCGTSTSQYTLSGGTSSFFFSTTRKQSGFTVTATQDGDTQTGTSSAITIDPAAASAILVVLPGQSFVDGTGVSGSSTFTGLRTPNATAGVSFDVDLRAVDAYNNLVDSGTNNYGGSKTVSWADSLAGNAPDTTTPSFPAASTAFTNGSADNLTITYYNATTGRTVEADDTGTPVSGTASSTFVVQAGVADDYVVAPAGASQTAGAAFNVTITARDQWQNTLGGLYSAPAGTYTWSTNATAAPDSTGPSIGTLADSDFVSGVATKSVTLYNVESGITFTASEPGPSTVTGTTTTTVSVSASDVSAANTDSSVTGDPTVTAGNPLTVTITLLDAWQNPVAGVTAANIVLSGTNSPSITQPSVNTDASGQTTGILTWGSTGAQTVSVQINTIDLVQGDGVTPDADGFLDDTHAVTVEAQTNSSSIQGGTTIRGGTRIE